VDVNGKFFAVRLEREREPLSRWGSKRWANQPSYAFRGTAIRYRSNDPAERVILYVEFLCGHSVPSF